LGATVQGPVGEGRDRAIAAAQRGDLDSLRAIAAEHGRGAVVAEEDPDELTTLHVAAGAGHEAIVRFLVSEEIGADPNALRVNHFSPLHAAAMNGHTTLCRILLEAGADVDVQTNPQKYSPLHSAAWGGHGEVVEVLLAHGARRDFKSHRDETPAQTALRQGHDAVARLIDGPEPEETA